MRKYSVISLLGLFMEFFCLVSTEMNIEWHVDYNITRQLDNYCSGLAYSKMILILIRVHTSNNNESRVLNHLNYRRCNYIELLFECDRCIAEIFDKIYQFHDKIILIENENFNFSDSSSLISKVTLISRTCSNQCRMIIFINGQDFSLTKEQEMVHNSLYASDINLRIILVYLKKLDDPLMADGIVYIRPILNGCVHYEGIFIPSSPQQFQSLRTIPSRCNLNSSILRVVLNDANPFCRIKTLPDNSVELDGYSVEVEFIQQLGEYFNFNIEFVSAHQIWGEYFNGTYNGLVGHLANKSCHIGICTVSRTRNRSYYLDFTDSHLTDEYSMISQNPPMKPPNLVLLNVMHHHVWSLLAVFYLFSVFFLLFVIKNKTGNVALKDIIRVEDILIQIILSKPIQPNISLFSLWSFRMIILFWALAMLIFVQFLGAQLYSILNFNEFEDYVDSVETLTEFAQTDARLVFTLNLTSILAFFKSRVDVPLHKTLLDHFDRNNPVMVNTIYEGILRVEENDRAVFLAPKYRAYYVSFVQARKSIHVSKTGFFTDIYQVALQKHSPLLLPFNHIIKYFHRTGIFDYLKNKPFIKSKLALLENKDVFDSTFETFRDEVSALSMSHMRSIFVTYLLGIFLASLFFIFECWWVIFGKKTLTRTYVTLRFYTHRIFTL